MINSLWPWSKIRKLQDEINRQKWIRDRELEELRAILYKNKALIKSDKEIALFLYDKKAWKHRIDYEVIGD